MAPRRMIARIAESAARAYVPGERLADALRTTCDLHARGFRTTVGYWNDEHDGSDRVRAEWLAAVAALAGRADAQVSVKLPALGTDPRAVGCLVGLAAEEGVRVHFDALEPEWAQRILDLAVSLGWPGVTLPARWRRSLADADRVAGEGLSVRVVKGQWGDPDDPRRDARRGYLEVIDRLAGTRGLVGVATHDGALAAEALARLTAAGTPCELQLLFGLRGRDSLAAARKLGVPVRAYVPYGAAYLPYGISALRREPRVAGRLAADLLLGRRDWAPRPEGRSELQAALAA